MNPKWQVVLVSILLVVIAIKGIILPGWVTAVELIAVCALLGVRWLFEPKPFVPASKDDIEEMKKAVVNVAEQIKVVDGKVGAVRLKMGFK